MSDTASIACIDAGTTGCRTIIFSRQGNILSQAYQEYSSIFHSPTWIDHDPATWIQAAHQTLQQAVAQFPGNPGDIAAICVISQRATFIAVDHHGAPLEHAILWQDKRATSQADSIRRAVGPEVIYQKTGLRIDPYFSLPKLLWLQEHKPQLLKKTYKLLTVHDLLINYLTGAFITDWTQASRTMLFNLTRFEWDEELCEQFEIPEKILPQPVAPGTIVGALKKNLQTELNLRSDLPVVAVGGDQQAAAVGLGVAWFAVCEYRHRVVYFSTCRTSGFDEQQRVVCTASAIAGKWLLEASIFTSGSVYRWFRDNFGLRVWHARRRVSYRLTYDLLEQ